MGYAVFAAKKQTIASQLNCVQLQHLQRSDEQFSLATDQLSLKQQLSSLSAAHAGELADLYAKLSEAKDTNDRAAINAQIKEIEERFKQETDDINRQTYEVSIKEQAIQMEVKRLDTVVTVLQHQLEAVEQAEGKEIQNATPKFGGLG